ncbi:MAG: carbohydrate ABC transporter permease [Clostridiales bacterium]|jgi:ABC-type glycerol-3-phosphate transport system permease component|nr:carbohydrate ABC transporter permease [Clostridiales bacterium]
MGQTTVNPDRFHKSQIPFYCLLVPLAAFMALPIIFIVFHAFKPMDEIFAYPPQFYPRKPTLENFRALFTAAKAATVPVSRYVFNSVLATALVVLGTIIISSLAGFALSKMDFRLKGAIFAINNAALMFVPAAVTIPRYMTITFLGIDDTFLAHVLPLLAMPVALFLLKQFIDQIPDALIDAATVDGAGALSVFFKVILPMIRPAVATGAILAFQLSWNNIETSSVFTTQEEVRTLAFYMSTLSASGAVAGQGMAAAATLVMFVPNLVLFVILQSNVMNTMAHSGLK